MGVKKCNTLVNQFTKKHFLGRTLNQYCEVEENRFREGRDVYAALPRYIGALPRVLPGVTSRGQNSGEKALVRVEV